MAEGIFVGSVYATFELNEKGVSQSVGNIQNSLSNVGNSLTSVGQRFTLGVSAPIVAGLGISSALFGDFDKTVRLAGVTMGATGKQADSLRELAKRMGAETAFSAQDAADALLELAKGGMSVAQIEGGALAETLKLASAGGLDLGAAAQYVVKGLNMFGLQASEAGRVTTALAGGANASTASVDDLGLALSQVGPGVQLLGYNIEDTVAVLAEFANVGIRGSDAGTSLKTMLQRLSPQTAEAAAAMKQLGLNFFNAQGKALPLRDIAQLLQDKLKGLTDEQRQNALTTIFGADAYRAAAVLADGGAKSVDKYAAATRDSKAASDLAKAATDGQAGAIERAKGSLETMAITIGERLAPFVSRLANGINTVADAFGKLPSGIQEVVIGLALVLASVGPVLLVTGNLITAYVDLRKAMLLLPAGAGVFALIAAGVVIAIAAFVALNEKFDLIRRAGDALQAVFRAVGDYIQRTVVPVITTLKDEAVKLYQEGFNKVRDAISDMKKKFEDVKDTLDKHKEALNQIAGVATVIVGPALIRLGVTALISAGQMAIAATLSAASWAAAAVTAGIAWTIEFAGMIARSIITGVTMGLQAIVAAAGWIAQAVLVGITWTVQFGIMVAQAIGTAIVMAAQAIVAGYAWIFQAISVAVAWTVTTFPGIVASAFSAAVSLGSAAISGAIPWITQAASAALAWTVSFVSMTVKAAATAVAYAASAVISGISWIIQAGLAAGAWVAAFVVMIVQAAAVRVAMVASAVASGVAWLIALGPIGLVIAAVALVIAIVVALATNFGGLRDKALEVFGRIGSGVSGLVGDFISAGANMIRGLANGIANGKDAVIGKIKEICSSALNSVKSFFGIHSPSRVMRTQGNYIMAGLSNGIDQAGQQAVRTVTNISKDLLSASQTGNLFDTQFNGISGRTSAFSSRTALALDPAATNGSTGAMNLYGDINVKNPISADELLNALENRDFLDARGLK